MILHLRTSARRSPAVQPQLPTHRQPPWRMDDHIVVSSIKVMLTHVMSVPLPGCFKYRHHLERHCKAKHGHEARCPPQHDSGNPSVRLRLHRHQQSDGKSWRHPDRHLCSVGIQEGDEIELIELTPSTIHHYEIPRQGPLSLFIEQWTRFAVDPDPIPVCRTVRVAMDTSVGSLARLIYENRQPRPRPLVLMRFGGLELCDPDQPLSDAGVCAESMVEFVDYSGSCVAAREGPLPLFIRLPNNGGVIMREVAADTTVGGLASLIGST